MYASAVVRRCFGFPFLAVTVDIESYILMNVKHGFLAGRLRGAAHILIVARAVRRIRNASE